MQISHLFIPALALVSFASSLLPVVAGWIRWKHLSRPMRILLALLSFYVPYLIAQVILVYVRINTLWMGSVYDLAEFIVIALILAMWADNIKIRTAVKWAVAGMVLLWISAKLTYEPLADAAFVTSPAGSVVLVGMATSLMIVIVRRESGNLFRKEQFWILVAVIVYRAGTLPLFASIHKLLSLPLEKYAKIWSINWSLTIVMNVLYTIGFLSNSNGTRGESLSSGLPSIP